jgi:trk system potassium uptake protein TrkH
VYRELMRAMHPNAVWPVRVGGAPVPADHRRGAGLRLHLHGQHRQPDAADVLPGLDILTGFSAVVATINNTGPGLNQVGPATTFGVLTDFQTWVCSLAMLLGRLEIFTLLVVLTPAFWRR